MRKQTPSFLPKLLTFLQPCSPVWDSRVSDCPCIFLIPIFSHMYSCICLRVSSPCDTAEICFCISTCPNLILRRLHLFIFHSFTDSMLVNIRSLLVFVDLVQIIVSWEDRNAHLEEFWWEVGRHQLWICGPWFIYSRKVWSQIRTGA